MSPRTFSGDVKCRFLDSEGDHRCVELLAPLDYMDSKGVLWSAYKGQISDGASIPQAFWSLIGGPFEGPYRRPAQLHDSAYEHGGTMLRSDGTILTYTREDADAMLRDAMIAEGASIDLADAIYENLRAFGWIAWEEDARKREEKR